MTERQEEQAALHALRMLDAEETRILLSEARVDAKLRETLADFEDAVAQLGFLLPAESPPEELRARILRDVKRRKPGSGSKIIAFPFRLLGSPWVAWAAAIAIAVGAYNMWKTNHSLATEAALADTRVKEAQSASSQARAEADELSQKLAKLGGQNKDLLAEVDRWKQLSSATKMEVAALKSSLNKYEEGVAVIVWDPERQEGKLKIKNMPPVQASKDYQLWVVDKSNPDVPVSGGVVKLNADGSATMTFKPVTPVSSASAFAISVEKEGGVPKGEGPIVLSGR